jgi:hypothetical protein
VPVRYQWNQELRRQGTAASWKREDNQRNLQEVHWTVSKLPNLLLGYKEPKIEPYGGVNPLQNGKKKLDREVESVM